jgi:hypothetical protein
MMTTLRIFLTIATLLALTDQTFAKKPRKPPGTIVNWKDVPAPIQATVQNNAGGGKVKEVQKETVGSVMIYCAEVKGTDGKWMKVYVNDAGTLMRTELDNARNKRKHKPLFGG